MVKFVPFTLLFLLSTACIKTAEQVQREKRFDSVSQQIGDTQGLLADMVARMKDLQAQLDRMNGRLEELEHHQQQVNPESLKTMNENMALLKTQQEAQTTQLGQIQNELKAQREFVEKVTESLAAVKEKQREKAAPENKKKTARAELEKGLNFVKEDKYGDARTQLEALIDHPDLTPGDHNKVFHGLGRTEFYSGKPDKAIVYFSKIYTRFPRSSLAPSSLLFIGRSLDKMGKKEEAKQAFQKVIEDYKGSKEADEARKEL